MSSEWGMSNGEWGECPLGSPCARLRHSTFPIPHSSRRGVTLIELLITMAIMAIISAAILGTASAAMEAARRTRTQQLVTRIHGLLTERLASYETRRVEINQQWLSGPEGIETKLRNGDINVVQRGQMMADLQLLAKRELIKCEMPDRWTDFTAPTAVVLSAKPTLAQTYARRYLAVGGDGPTDQYQAAECLYMTVMSATGDGEARTLFNKQDIGDADEDGMPEFIDGWGTSIGWVRWPAGFIVRSPLMSADAEADHDPVDIYRRDQLGTVPVPANYPALLRPYVARLRDGLSAFRLVPLVYSSGPDGISDVDVSGTLSVLSSEISLDPYALTDPTQNYDVINNPFLVGAPRDPDDDGDNSKDNIHSHLIEY